jgi:uncharacterized membrane protein YhfC
MLLLMHVLNPTLMVVIPLALGVWAVRRWKLDWGVFGLGALTFILSQVIHIPFNQFVLAPLMERLGWFNAEGWPWVMAALLLGLSAGLFEELARYLVLRRISNRVQIWSEGVLYGLGHGGVEAIIIGSFAFYGLFQALALRGGALEGLVSVNQLDTVRIQLESYWGMAWYEPLWATLERLSALAFHTMAALLVLLAIRERRKLWLVAAVLVHTLFNAVALVSVKALGIAVTEVILAGIALVFLWTVFRLRSRLAAIVAAQTPQTQAAPRSQPKPNVEAIEAERLDESRFL